MSLTSARSGKPFCELTLPDRHKRVEPADRNWPPVGANYLTGWTRAIANQRRDQMITKVASILAAVLILGSASVASAATTHRVVKHHNYPVTAIFYPEVRDVFANF
jgi:hypothetical protein